ncbi:MAG: sulfotransferase [Candidatus Paceibacterota bacterium]
MIARRLNEQGCKIDSLDHLPQAIGIGTRRCASSTVHHWLNQHPEVGKPPRGLHFFSQHYHRGLNWYCDQLGPHDRAKVLVESSVSYSYPEYFHNCIDRIAKLNPKMKIFLTVRHPIDRAFSDFLRSQRHCELPRTIDFATAINTNPELLERGRYGRLLTHVFDRFPKHQVSVLYYDDLLAKPQEFSAQLYTFLGIDSKFSPTAAEDPARGRNTVRWAGFNRLVYGTKSIADSVASQLHLGGRWAGFKKHGHFLYQHLLAWNTVQSQLPDEIIPRLLDYYESDINALELFTGRSLDEWRSAA